MTVPQTPWNSLYRVVFLFGVYSIILFLAYGVFLMS